LRVAGWNILIVRECELKQLELLAFRINRFLNSRA